MTANAACEEEKRVCICLIQSLNHWFSFESWLSVTYYRNVSQLSEGDVANPPNVLATPLGYIVRLAKGLSLLVCTIVVEAERLISR